jgi:iron complex outermembrane receptor protein
MQSQNVMKVEHESIKIYNERSTLIELIGIPGVSQVSTGTSIGNR